jgi:hypothetical protein
VECAGYAAHVVRLRKRFQGRRTSGLSNRNGVLQKRFQLKSTKGQRPGKQIERGNIALWIGRFEMYPSQDKVGVECKTQELRRNPLQRTATSGSVDQGSNTRTYFRSCRFKGLEYPVEEFYSGASRVRMAGCVRRLFDDADEGSA